MIWFASCKVKPGEVVVVVVVVGLGALVMVVVVEAAGGELLVVASSVAASLPQALISRAKESKAKTLFNATPGE